MLAPALFYWNRVHIRQARRYGKIYVRRRTPANAVDDRRNLCRLYGVSNGMASGAAIGCVVALSSTALVYRSMTDLGVAGHKTRADPRTTHLPRHSACSAVLILPRILGSGKFLTLTYGSLIRGSIWS